LIDDPNEFKINQYKTENIEMYGPLWIFVTLVVEFVILGNLANSLDLMKKASGNNELMMLLSQKAAS
jgi:hypothetical protein